MLNPTQFQAKEEKVKVADDSLSEESIMKENENEDDLDYELDDASINSDNKNNIFLPEMKMVKDEDIEPKASKNTQRKNNNQTLSMNDDNENSLGLNDGSLCESDKGNQSSISLPKLEKLTIGSKPPKDFVCPITDERLGETLNSVDSDFDCLATLLKNDLVEAALLIYQLRPVFAQLSAHELTPSLVQVIQNTNKGSNDFQLAIDPKDVDREILEQILIRGDEYSKSLNALSVISQNGIPALAKYLERMKGRRLVVSILLCCMQPEKGSKSLIADIIELSPVLELFHGGNDNVRGIYVEFLLELVQLNRRTVCNQILQTIKDEGAFSMMHTFLVYLHMAPMEHQLVASVLLVEPRKMSIYREEAVETLIEALWQKDFSNTQMKALDALLFLIGHVTLSGKSYTKVWLLKIVGFDQPYNALIKAKWLGQYGNDSMETMDEKNVMNTWQKRVAFVLCHHENGSIFQALEECLRINSLKMEKSCLVLVIWLTHMLSTFPDTDIKDVACKSLLHELINVLQSSNNLEEKIRVSLALKNFINDLIAQQELRAYAKSIYKIMRKLIKYSTIVVDIMKTLLNLNSIDVGTPYLRTPKSFKHDKADSDKAYGLGTTVARHGRHY
ncbi:putative E3 ubiquitin-protein ligase LIN-1 [Glycine soja]|uniref:Putative E3 ubiquitin-protein ligase LIN-1 n=1 Tax=Glycine soja TaxID=3848 RepID=A0A445HRQ7_GLYSO|nr:putative E3 ubiquitin-protein ligase LIN-1 [Glycine soja]